ncbi:unnamed protein product [Thelazia callipaeda]|uniref:ALMS_motif domain-containing protein n=1 Tax=Thelazia callipaeda TaxID=103827 RepID=A0A0N5D672_THECL|nr:unnamed protein product [Thelazia callipaeda]
MGRVTTKANSSSHLSLLTLTEQEDLIQRERQRRRLIRYQQVRQLSSENAAKIRERVRLAKEKRMETLKKHLTDAIVHRNHLDSGKTSPSAQATTTLKSMKTPRKSQLHQITSTQIKSAIRRHREAIKKLHQERDRDRRRHEFIQEMRRKVWAEANANQRSRRRGSNI